MHTLLALWELYERRGWMFGKWSTTRTFKGGPPLMQTNATDFQFQNLGAASRIFEISSSSWPLFLYKFESVF